MDISYLLLLQDLRNATGSAFDSFFLVITKFGENYFPYLLCLFVFWAVDKKFGERLMLTMGSAIMLNGVLKLTVCAYRPWIRNAAVLPAGDAKTTATGYSFPSGHTTQATAAYGTSAVHYRRHKGLAACLTILLLLVMFSRNYLGVHTPQDVLVGFGATALVAYIMNLVLTRIENSQNKQSDLIFLCIIAVLIAAALFYFTHKTYPMDYNADGSLIVDPLKMMRDSFSGCGCCLGIFIGWVFERRFVNFSVDVSMETKAARCISGILLYLFLMNFCYVLFLKAMGSLWGAFIGSMVIFFYFVGIHPLLFCCIEGKKKTA
ncbi:MAG: phosphatase PAP2 family protein [Butyrivibrio sp.]|jgi:membrane-associated phospholipid phosphatase|nr:phosphatase PAP2 family protein [Butyrivibrio sp.]